MWETVGWVAIGSFGFLATAGICVCLVRYRKSRIWGYFDYKSRQDLTGKTIIITGGNTGLGYEAAKILAEKKAIVILACRDPTKGRIAAEEISIQTGNTNISFLQLDLASLDSVRNFAKNVNEKLTGLDVLVCNAGVWVPMENKLRTRDNFEIHFGVNHLGHFLLTKLLLPMLNKNSGRVVVVSSSLMNSGQLSMDNLDLDTTDLDQIDQLDFVREGRKLNEGEKKGVAPLGYCDSKLANALFTQRLDEKIKDLAPNVTTYALCPGFCGTELGRNIPIPTMAKVFLAPIFFMIQRSAWRGSLNIIHAVMEHKEFLKSGGFYKECKLANNEMEKLNEMRDNGEKLWRLSEKLTS